MAISITKVKAAPPKESVETTVSAQDLSKISIEELADQYGTLQDRIAAIPPNPLYAQFELVEKELKSRLEEQGLEPADTAELTGAHWLLEIGACSKNPRKLKPDAIPMLQTMLGGVAFGKIAKVNIGDIEKYCTPPQVEAVIETDTGYSKSRKIVAKYLG